MSELFSPGGPERQNAYNKLKSFIQNPGMFSLLVLGKRGTGKKYAIQHIFNEFKKLPDERKKKLCLSKLEFLDHHELGNDTKAIQSHFKKNAYGTLVIGNADKLNPIQQELLFKALQTTDGRLGLTTKVNIRIVFTSSSPIEELSSGLDNISSVLWDRISQLLIQLPSFEVENDSVITDFKAIWMKMNFKNIQELEHLSNYPKNTKLQSFLEHQAYNFKGGFRDLDKIAILYFNYRIFCYKDSKKIAEETENEIVDYVRTDFSGKLQTKEKTISELAVFHLNEGETMENMVKRLKGQARKWAVSVHGSVGKAENKLGLAKGTMKNYV